MTAFRLPKQDVVTIISPLLLAHLSIIFCPALLLTTIVTTSVEIAGNGSEKFIAFDVDVVDFCRTTWSTTHHVGFLSISNVIFAHHRSRVIEKRSIAQESNSSKAMLPKKVLHKYIVVKKIICSYPPPLWCRLSVNTSTKTPYLSCGTGPNVACVCVRKAEITCSW